MESKRKFSEVSHAFNVHAANLDRARVVFEKEARQLKKLVLDYLEAFLKKPVEDPTKVVKVRWADPQDWSILKEVAWLNFRVGCQLQMDVLQPGFRKYKLSAGLLYFAVDYDEDLEQFMFSSRFVNYNTVNDDIDEKLRQLINDAGAERFPRSLSIKPNEVVLFRRELQDGVFDFFNQYTDDAIQITSRAVDLVFPDSLYREGVAG